MCQFYPFLDCEVLWTITHALATTLHLIYCNALPLGLSFKTIVKLQPVQNVNKWTVIRVPHYAYLTTLLCELHWLLFGFQVLVVPLKSFRGIDHRKDQLYSIVSAYLVESSRKKFSRSYHLKNVILQDPESTPTQLQFLLSRTFFPDIICAPTLCCSTTENYFCLLADEKPHSILCHL